MQLEDHIQLMPSQMLILNKFVKLQMRLTRIIQIEVIFLVAQHLVLYHFLVFQFLLLILVLLSLQCIQHMKQPVLRT